MFTHLLKAGDVLLEVGFSNYARKHFLRRFEKDYRGRQWQFTLESILEDLRRIRVCGNDLQKSQQVDELWHRGDLWIFKYDFAVAQTGKSAKKSGNRCVVFLDGSRNRAEILLIFGKGDLPKNMGEQQFIEKTLKNEFGEYLARVK